MGEKLDPGYYRREAQLMRLKSDIETDSSRASEFRRLAVHFEQLAEAMDREQGESRKS
jgi:hypothetical protein